MPEQGPCVFPPAQGLSSLVGTTNAISKRDPLKVVYSGSQQHGWSESRAM